MNADNQKQHEEFCHLLSAMGIPLQGDWTPMQCSRATNAWLSASDVEALNRVKSSLNDFESRSIPLSSELSRALNFLRGARTV